MNEKTLKRMMTIMVLVGLALVLTAIYLAAFKKLHNTMGMDGIKIIVAVAGTGLVLMLPSKIYLTLLLMKNRKN